MSTHETLEQFFQRMLSISGSPDMNHFIQSLAEHQGDLPKWVLKNSKAKFKLLVEEAEEKHGTARYFLNGDHPDERKLLDALSALIYYLRQIEPLVSSAKEGMPFVENKSKAGKFSKRRKEETYNTFKRLCHEGKIKPDSSYRANVPHLEIENLSISERTFYNYRKEYSKNIAR